MTPRNGWGPVTTRYAAFGLAVGLLVPTAAVGYLVASSALPPGTGLPALVAGAHRTEPLMLVVWAVPVLLSVLAAFAGTREARLRRFSSRLEAEVLEKTESLRSALVEARHANEMIAHMADHDPLTGLYNRRRLREELGHVFAAAQRYHRTAAVLFLDLDDLKAVNDHHGHEAGDEVLRRVAAVLRGLTRATDFACRWGGDEFALLLSETSREGACVLAERIVAACREQRVRVGTSERDLSCSVGVAVYPEGANSADELIAHADAAMYRAKRSGGGKWLLYRGDHAELGRLAESRRWATRVRQALDGDRLVVWYQPVLSLATESCREYEALVRLEDASGAIFVSEVFVDAAEESGLGAALDRLVLTKALRRIASVAGGDDPLTISVNVFPQTLLDPGLAEFLRETAAGIGADLSRLRLEVADWIAAQNVGPLEPVVTDLKRLGCHLVADDFGSGFLSFVHLRRLGIASVKLDRALVENVDSNADASALLRSYVQSLRGIGIDAVAKCVEHPSLLPILRDHGVARVQGFAVGRPSESLETVSFRSDVATLEGAVPDPISRHRA